MPIYYDKVFLQRAEETMLYDVGAVKKNMPKNSGKTMYFNRFSSLPKATTPLTEAATPSAVDMTSTVVSATIAEYGTYTKVSSLFDMTSIDENLKEHVEVLGQNAGETLDELIAAELSANATAQYANAKSALTAIAATDTIDGQEIRRSVRTLKINRAKTFSDGLFKSIIPAQTAYDLRGDSEWLDAYKYTDASNIRDGLLGKLHGTQFYETNNEVSQASTVTVYSTFVFGQYAYGVMNIQGQPDKRIYVKRPSDTDTSNPLNTWSTVGWKSSFATRVLNSSWIVQIFTSAGS